MVFDAGLILKTFCEQTLSFDFLVLPQLRHLFVEPGADDGIGDSLEAELKDVCVCCNHHSSLHRHWACDYWHNIAFTNLMALTERHLEKRFGRIRTSFPNCCMQQTSEMKNIPDQGNGADLDGKSVLHDCPAGLSGLPASCPPLQKTIIDPPS